MGDVLEHALVDSNALAQAAKTIGVTIAQAKRLLGELTPEQGARIITSVRAERLRASNRTVRLAGER